MTDKVRCLKIEHPSEGGTETDYLPTEMDPSEDYLAAKGIAFNDDTAFAHEHLGRTLVEQEPYTTFAVTYLGNGDVDYIEYFNSNTQITANKIYKQEFSYDGDLNLTQVLTKIYDTDGATVLRTITQNLTYTSSTLTSGNISS
jgi:hypothetical protein